MRPGNPFILGQKQKVKVTSHKHIAGVDLCTLVSAGFFWFCLSWLGYWINCYVDRSCNVCYFQFSLQLCLRLKANTTTKHTKNTIFSLASIRGLRPGRSESGVHRTALNLYATEVPCCTPSIIHSVKIYYILFLINLYDMTFVVTSKQKSHKLYFF